MSAATSFPTVVELHPDLNKMSVSYDTDRPTAPQYAAYEQMFAHLNEQLFEGMLPQPILTFSRRAQTLGFFLADRWSARDDEKRTVSEIAINPDRLKSQKPIGVASTLVHEMTHLWQHVHGKKKSRTSYHNDEWAQKMESIGLQSSSTGEPGGKRVGQKMSDYVIAGGRFEQAFKAMPSNWFFPFLSEATDGKKKPSSSDSSKTKFTCSSCGDSARGKPTLEIGCRKCSVPMVRDCSPGADTSPAPTTSDPADSAFDDMETPEDDRNEDDDDDAEYDEEISDATFAHLAPKLLSRMLRAGRSGFSVYDLARSMRGATPGKVIAVARRLIHVLGVVHMAGPKGGSTSIILQEGKTPEVEVMLRRMAADARRTRLGAKRASSSADIGWLDRALDAEGDADGDPTSPIEHQASA